MKKYELTEETKIVSGVTLHRIRALKNFGRVMVGDIGGWIESELNLNQEGNAKVYDHAMVFGNARVYGDARVCDNAMVCGNARVCDNARVYDDARVCGTCIVENGKFPQVKRSDGYDFCAFKCSDDIVRITAGCRYFTLEEAREHWEETRGGTELGDETMDILDYLEIRAKKVYQ